jgi:hypothetical protein
MIHIKRFIDKIASMEGKQGRDVILPITDARSLRDEIAKLIIDRHGEAVAETTPKPQNNEVIQVEVKGGRW